mgnify:CR=1 FL=1
MNTDIIFDQVAISAAESLMVDRSEIKPETRLEDLGATSLDFVTIALDLEDKFGANIFDDDSRKFETAAEIVDYVRSKISKVNV